MLEASVSRAITEPNLFLPCLAQNLITQHMFLKVTTHGSPSNLSCDHLRALITRAPVTQEPRVHKTFGLTRDLTHDETSGD